MKIDSSRQAPATPPDAGGQYAGQGAEPNAQPAMHDTSGAGGDGQAAAYNGAPVKGQSQSTPPAGNVGTKWKFDDNGKPVLVGYFPVPKRPPGDSHVDTPWDVFKRGFTGGITHPGQTFGKIADMKKGDDSHANEAIGKKVDQVLQQLPVIGQAMTITQGAAGEKNPDGTPVLPAPDVQPDAEGHISPGAAGKPSVKASPGKPSMREPGAPSTPSKAPAGAGEGAPGASTRAPAAPPKAGEPQVAPRTGEAPPGAGPAGSAHFDVPEQYAGKPSGKLQADLHAPGVFRDDKGQAYIQTGGHTWPVRYDKDNGTWRVYQPNDPARYQYPVRADEKGHWQMHDDVGLKGGAPISAEQRREIIKLLRQKPPLSEHRIAERAHVSRSIVRDIVKKEGIERPGPYRILAEKRQRAIELLRQQPRMSYSKIAKIIGISERTLVVMVREIRANHPHRDIARYPAKGGGSATQASPSPQPGTSTGGQTHPGRSAADPSLPPTKRSRVDEQQPGQKSAPQASPKVPSHPDSPMGDDHDLMDLLDLPDLGDLPELGDLTDEFQGLDWPSFGPGGTPQGSPNAPSRPSSPPYSPPPIDPYRTPQGSPYVPSQPLSPPYSPPPIDPYRTPQGSPNTPVQRSSSPYAPRYEPITPASSPRTSSGPGSPQGFDWDIPDDLLDVDLNPWSP